MSESETNDHPSDDVQENSTPAGDAQRNGDSANSDSETQGFDSENQEAERFDETIVLESSGSVAGGVGTNGETPLESVAASAVGETVESVEEQPIRYGSPFAVDPEWVTDDAEPFQEVLLDVGPLKYTAMGSVAASALIVLFAAAAAFWFPGGGTLVAGLGVLLAVFGLYSHYRFKALGCLVAHLACFMISYVRALG